MANHLLLACLFYLCYTIELRFDVDYNGFTEELFVLYPIDE